MGAFFKGLRGSLEHWFERGADGGHHVYLLTYDYAQCLHYVRSEAQGRHVIDWANNGLVLSTLGDKHMPNCFDTQRHSVVPPTIRPGLVSRAEFIRCTGTVDKWQPEQELTSADTVQDMVRSMIEQHLAAKRANNNAKKISDLPPTMRFKISSPRGPNRKLLQVAGTISHPVRLLQSLERAVLCEIDSCHFMASPCRSDQFVKPFFLYWMSICGAFGCALRAR